MDYLQITEDDLKRAEELNKSIDLKNPIKNSEKVHKNDRKYKRKSKKC